MVTPIVPFGSRKFRWDRLDGLAGEAATVVEVRCSAAGYADEVEQHVIEGEPPVKATCAGGVAREVPDHRVDPIAIDRPGSSLFRPKEVTLKTLTLV